VVTTSVITDDIDDSTVSRALGEHRDQLRALLKKEKVIKNVTSPAPLMVRCRFTEFYEIKKTKPLARRGYIKSSEHKPLIPNVSKYFRTSTH
jgi:hypothetical protein